MKSNTKDFHKNKKDLTVKCTNLCCTKINSISVKIGNDTILKDVNIHIHCGEFTAIIGPNGAGKSTLLKAILGEIKHEGTLVFEKEKGEKMSYPVIGYVPQTSNFEKGSPISVLDLFVSCTTKYPVWLPIPKYIIKNVEKCLDRVSAKHLIDKRIGVLSGGEVQRVLLALALNPSPDLLLLDEPVSGIDIKGMELFYEIVDSVRKEYDLSVVMVSHDMELVEKYADRVILIDKEVKKSGNPKEVFKSTEYNKIFRHVTQFEKDKAKNISGLGD